MGHSFTASVEPKASQALLSPMKVFQGQKDVTYHLQPAPHSLMPWALLCLSRLSNTRDVTLVKITSKMVRDKKGQKGRSHQTELYHVPSDL